MTKPYIAIVAFIGLTLSACGRMTPLEPSLKKETADAETGSAAAPNTDKLLQTHPQATPNRNTELRYRSEQREDDPYDLPPPQ